MAVLLTLTLPSSSLGCDPAWLPITAPALLSPEEFLLLYAALATPELLQGAPARAIERLEQWSQRHPDLAAREPARTVVENVRTSVEAGRGR